MTAPDVNAVELRDAIAKAIADAVGNGMREKYERHAEAALTVVAPQLLLTAKHAESDHLTQPAQAVDVGAIEAVIRELCKWPKEETFYDHRATRLACAEKLRALGNAQADGWRRQTRP